MDPAGPRALVVDDDPALRAQLRGWLESAGWAVDEAGGAWEAEEKLSCVEYGVVVLDFVLPDADGVQCVRSWRAMGVTAPVLGLTGAHADAVLEAFIKAGAHDVLEKTHLARDAFLQAVEATSGPPGYPEEALPRMRRLRDVPSFPEQGPDPPALPRSALVVDDTPVFRVLLRRYLERLGWSVREACSAEEALQHARGAPLDLVLVDYLLPDMDGATLLRKLRKAGVDAPVLAMTGHATEDVADELASAGAAACLPKESLNEERLRAAVRGVTGPRGAQDPRPTNRREP